jgi:ABC-type branched-subunit amino acid transport system ATPase component
VTLAVRALGVQFGGVTALADVSFVVAPGTITSLIGPNGAGKTTAFNAITGYLRPTRGSVVYDGVPLDGLRPSEISRRGIVRTFQKTSVFPTLSVEENVMIGLHPRGRAGFWSILAARRSVRAEETRLTAQAAEILTFVGLAHRRHAEASALPYGEQRLVELAVALAALGAAYEQLDERSGDALEEQLFRPVQVAYGRAQRTHAGFAERHGLPGRKFEPATARRPSQSATALVESAVDAVEEADAILAELQDSMRPVEVGDAELRAGLARVRELVGSVRASARRFVGRLGR